MRRKQYTSGMIRNRRHVNDRRRETDTIRQAKEQSINKQPKPHNDEWWSLGVVAVVCCGNSTISSEKRHCVSNKWLILCSHHVSFVLRRQNCMGVSFFCDDNRTQKSSSPPWRQPQDTINPGVCLPSPCLLFAVALVVSLSRPLLCLLCLDITVVV